MKCSIVLAGALLPQDLAVPVLREARAPTLTALLAQSRGPATVALDTCGAAHLDWLWQAFGGTAAPPVTAPYAWAALAGQPPAGALWQAHAAHLGFARDHLLLEALDGADAPDGAERAALTPALERAAQDANATVQQTGHRAFVQFEPPWTLAVTPFDAALGQAAADTMPAGPAGRAWRSFTNDVQMQWHALPMNAAREADGRRTVNALWLDGGGTWQPLPPSRWQQCRADAAAVRGWALAAGLAADAVAGAATPLAPRRDAVVLLDALWPWRQRDAWGDWLAALAAVDAALAALVARWRADGGTELEVVAGGVRACRRVLIRRADRWQPWRRWRRTALDTWLVEP